MRVTESVLLLFVCLLGRMGIDHERHDTRKDSFLLRRETSAFDALLSVPSVCSELTVDPSWPRRAPFVSNMIIRRLCRYMDNQNPLSLPLQLLFNDLLAWQPRQGREPLPLAINDCDSLHNGDESLGVVPVHASFELSDEPLDAHSLWRKCFLDFLCSRKLGLAGGRRFAFHWSPWTTRGLSS